MTVCYDEYVIITSPPTTMDYIDYVINNKAAHSRARSAENRKVLVAMVFEKIGYRAPKKMTTKELKEILYS